MMTILAVDRTVLVHVPISGSGSVYDSLSSLNVLTIFE